jgi:hypothetical protein
MRGLRVNPTTSDLSPDYGFPASPRCPHRNHHAWLAGPTAPHATDYSTGSDSPRGCKPLAALPPYETPGPCGFRRPRFPEGPRVKALLPYGRERLSLRGIPCRNSAKGVSTKTCFPMKFRTLLRPRMLHAFCAFPCQGVVALARVVMSRRPSLERSWNPPSPDQL